MKRFFSSFSLSVLLVGLAPVMASAGDCYVDPVYQQSGSGTIRSAVFVRDQACVSGSNVIMTLSAGATVSVVAFTDGWYRVETSDGARGWVGEQFVENRSQRLTMTWTSYDEYMSTYPSRSPSGNPPPPNGETVYTGSIEARSLIKLVCPAVADVNHPCKAVYYIGADGKRHAFPNSRVYFTWYLDFDSVRAVSSDRLGQYSLGANATYRPGERMVKFTTDPKVYAVARGGILRWVKTEDLARAYYGLYWNQKIDDIPDTFYTNYTFGTEINAEADYNPTTERMAAQTID